MKRGGNLKRRTPLKANAAMTAAFVQRGRENAREKARGREGMRSMELRAATAPSDFRDDDGLLIAVAPLAVPRGLSPGKPRRSVTIPKATRAAVLVRTHGICVMCLHKQGLDVHMVSIGAVRQFVRTGVVGRATQLHHVLPQGKWPHLAKVEANLVGLDAGCHDEHERAHRRLPRCVLPPETLALAEAEGLMWFIERVYPRSGE